MVIDWLKHKLFSVNGYMLIGIVFVLLITAPFLYRSILDTYKQTAYEQFETHVREQAGLLADILSVLDISNRNQVDNVLDLVLLKGKTTYVEIIDDENQTLHRYTIEDGGNVKFIADDYIGQHNDNTYYISLPVHYIYLGNAIYQLRMGFDESAVNEAYRNLKIRALAILSAYIILVILIIGYITRMLLKPMKELRRQSREIAEGNIHIPIHIATKLQDIKYLSNDLEIMRFSLVDMAETMQFKATHDELTNLPNRFLFNDRLHTAISVATRENKNFSVLLIDLNRFKEINDTLGHGMGDKVLQEVSRRLQEEIRESDTFARIGGDEYAVILTGVGQIIAEKIACKLYKLIEPAITVGEHTLNVGASIGIAVYPDDGNEAELLLQHADIAMYHAKRNNLVVASYHPDMDVDSYENLILANDMKHSIEAGHFRPLFQPKIDVKSGKLCGCEILMRWQHPELGLICPDKFIPLAEQENLIGILTRWMISNYLEKFRRLIKVNPDFTISINISPNDLLDTALFNAIKEILNTSHFPANRLFIEVTENAIMKNPARSTDILTHFHELGIAISVDDFGTGYSSLAYLQKFPITELKIDKSFISHLTKASNDYMIVNATIAMAHDLQLRVVAEGVETVEVLELLKGLNCDCAQVYYFSKPLEYDDFQKWLNDY